MTFTHLDSVLAEVAPLGRLFSDAGYRLFLVGGIVRDQLRGQPLDASSDIDLTTDAVPAEIKRLVAPFADDLWTQGERFGTIGLRAAGRDYEITTHRAESYTSDSRKPDVRFGDDIEVDLSRRDFTVNAMAIELPDGELVDPYGGAADLTTRVLRTPLSADASFTDDPLRMLRAARFAAKYSLTLDDDIVDSATRLHDRLRIVAIERIGVELQRLLACDEPATGLIFLAETGVLNELLNYGLGAAAENISGRLAGAVDATRRLAPNWRQRLAAIGISVFDTHDGVQSMCRRLKLSRDDERQISRATSSALAIIAAGDTRPETLRRWIATCDDQAAALELAQAVAADTAKVDTFAGALAALIEAEDTVEVELLDGDTIMSLLEVSPSRAVGEASEYLRKCYFERGPIEPADQIDLLRSWWSKRQRRPPVR